MPLFTREDMELLLSPHPRPCVSLFLPTHRHHPGTDQDPIRFKNLLRRAAELLAEGHGPKAARELLDPLEALATPLFWSHQKDGLAIFRSSDLLVHYRLPLALEELVVVADSFHVRPVASFLQSHRRFYVLALAQKSIALFEGTPETLAPVAVDELPTSILDTLGVDRSAGVLNLRTLPGAGSPALFHGQGGPDESKKADLARFFREVDRALWSILRDESAPLVLAGVAYYLPLYREASRYRNLLDRAVAAIAKVVVHGRVRRLLLADGAHVWGTLDAESGEIRLADGQQDARDDDVLDDLAENVLVRGGDVLAVPPGRLPGDAPASALLRW